MNIFFKGYYGYNNLGDDIFVHIAKWYCESLDQQAIPIFVGKDLPKGITYKKVNNKYIKNAFELYYLFKADYIIYWGGSTFENIDGIRNLKYWIKRFNFITKKFLAFGVSIGPFKHKDDKNNVIKLLSKSKYIGVRDYKSLEYDYDYNFTFDLAILSPLVFPIEKRKNEVKENIIGINFNKTSNIDEYYEFVRNFCIREEDKIDRIKIFVFNKYEKTEKKYSEDLEKELKANGLYVDFIPYNIETEEFIKEFVDINFLFGTRLHSGILAYSYDIKFVLNEYHEKCTSFVETINNPIRYRDLTNDFSMEDLENFDYSKIINSLEFKTQTLNELDNITRILEK